MPFRSPLRANREPDAKNTIDARRHEHDIPPRRKPRVIDPIERVKRFQTVFAWFGLGSVRGFALGGKSEDGQCEGRVSDEGEVFRGLDEGDEELV